jgi:hypothetical protein
VLINWKECKRGDIFHGRLELSSWKSTNIVTMLHGDVEKLLKVYIFAW